MLFKCVILCALLGSPVLSSAIKGYQAREEIKGYQATREEQVKSRPALAPVEQHRLIEQHQVKGQASLTKNEYRAEQSRVEAELPAEHKLEELPQQKEEIPRIESPDLAKGQLRFEAKPQVQREELKKYEQQREEQLPSKTKFEQKQEVRYEQKQEERLEQQQVINQQRELTDGQQQIELKEEQRRYPEESPLVQPILPLTIVEETRSEQQISQNQLAAQSVKGYVRAETAPLVAPPGLAEPYAFNYQVEGSSRQESGDVNGVVRGQYTVQGADGANRLVEYVADHNGFRATVNTNEFGTQLQSPANIALRTSQPAADEITLRLEGKTREELAAPAAIKSLPVPARPENWSSKGGFGPSQSQLALPQAPATLEEMKGSKRLTEELPYHAVPAKGQRLVQQLEEIPQELQAVQQEAAPAKSAELLVPKPISEPKLAAATFVQPRSSFESATAHRPVYRAQPGYAVGSAPRPVAPAVAIRAHPPPVVRGPVPVVSRAHLQRERYPPSPVQGYRRTHQVEQPVPSNPRVSFYAPSSANFEEEQPSFEHSES